jgi:hypothetical protein
MGSSLSDWQQRQIVYHFDEVVLMLDGDQAGTAAVPGIARRLERCVRTRAVEVPSGRQADQLSSRDLRLLLERFV